MSLEKGDISQVWENTKSSWNNTDEKGSLQQKLATLRPLDAEILALWPKMMMIPLLKCQNCNSGV